MKFMILLQGNADTEAGVMPSTELLTAMGAYNEALADAGVIKAGEGLQPTAKGARVYFDGEGRTAKKGPFPTDRLVSGFWIWECASLDEAIAWALKSPTGLGSDDVLTIHPMTEASDLPPEMVKIIMDAAPTWSTAWRKPR